MDKFIRPDDVVLLLNYYSSDSRNLYESFRKAGYGCRAVVIEDDGFLPEDVMSVYGFFLGNFKGERGIPGKPRYFNEIRVPRHWEISGNNTVGEIRDLHRVRGKIFYTEPSHKRLVKIVDWYDENKIPRSSDHYNRWGALYARTTFNARGQKVNKSYFSGAGREVIVENYVTGDIILNDKDQVRIFPNKTDFVLYALKCAGFEKNRIFYNSLSTPFFVSQRFHGVHKRDILFWQEPERDDIPGNMQIILRGQASRTSKIMVQKRRTYDGLMKLGASPETVHKLGFIYPFEKANRHRPEALICTNSDQIEHVREMVEALPGLHFHIAALTEMSSKLMSMESFENVTLYPGIKAEMTEELFERCDYYLDINRESEIVSAVYQAFLHDHLIFAFKETIHNRDYVADERIYGLDEWSRMAADIRRALEDEKELDRMLKGQRTAALAETEEGYLQFEEKKRRIVKENRPVTMYITNLYGENSRETRVMAQQNVACLARELGFKEMPVFKYQIGAVTKDNLRKEAARITSALQDHDIVLFQSPSWNRGAYDKELLKEIRRHRNIRLAIFIHDVMPLMTGGTEYDYQQVIEGYNLADLIIVPTESMLDFLRKGGLTVKKTLLQPMWDLPFSEELREPEFNRQIIFSGSPERFSFVSSWNYDIPLRLFGDGKPEPGGQNIIREGWKNTTELLMEYIRGGFGLVWEQSVQPDYYKSCQPHKLAAYLAAGIPVIMEKGLPHEQTVLDYELGFVTDSLEEAVARVKQVTEEEYRRLADHTKPIGNLVKGGFFTKKLLIDAVNYLMLG